MIDQNYKDYEDSFYCENVESNDQQIADYSSIE